MPQRTCIFVHVSTSKFSSDKNRILDTSAEQVFTVVISGVSRGRTGRVKVATGKLPDSAVVAIQEGLRFEPKFNIFVEGEPLPPPGISADLADTRETFTSQAVAELHDQIRKSQASLTVQSLQRESELIRRCETRVQQATEWADQAVRTQAERVAEAEKKSSKAIAELERRVAQNQAWAAEQIEVARKQVEAAYQWSTDTTEAVQAVTPAIRYLAKQVETKPETLFERVVANLQAADQTEFGKAAADGVRSGGALFKTWIEKKMK